MIMSSWKSAVFNLIPQFDFVRGVPNIKRARAPF